MKKENKILIISIVILLILNISIILGIKLKNNIINTNKFIDDVNIIRVSEEILTQGAIAIFEIQIDKEFDLKNTKAKVLNSVNREVEEGYIRYKDNKFLISVDTSTLLTGKYKVKLEFSDGIVISDDTFNVIIIEDDNA